MIRERPDLFYNQTWYEGEEFMAAKLPCIPERVMAPTVADAKQPPENAVLHITTLAALYVKDPKAPIWDRYLWTADTDRHGQRVYVGGRCNTGKLEIHRHIHLTARFGIPGWR